MQLSFLRQIDTLAGNFLLYALAGPARVIRFVWPRQRTEKQRHVFVKMKGGGSLIIALPALLGLRQKNPDAEFILVCAREAQIYGELSGIFDRFLVVDDNSVLSLVKSGLVALRASFQADRCIDLEPNSRLAAVFTMMTCAQTRIGLVKPEQASRALAYSSALSFNSISPIYIYYDRIAELLGAPPASPVECRAYFQKNLSPTEQNTPIRKTVALAPFTSAFARERMMPVATWCALLQRTYTDTNLDFIILGSKSNQNAASDMAAAIKRVLPKTTIQNLCESQSLRQATALLRQCDEAWSVDSGLLHIARLLGVRTHSFWGPTMPSQRLRPIDGLEETVHYRPFLCSPCIQASTVPPCRGNNLCMISMAEESPHLRPDWVRQ